MLKINNLKVKIEDKEILKGVNLEVASGQVVALMGPNGSGKSSLSNTLMGNPAYEITRGEILFEGQKINEMTPDERAHLGIYMAFQYPVSVPGVTVKEVMVAALRASGKVVRAIDVRKQIEEIAQKMKIGEDLLARGINEGFSGGEKKKIEILQMKVLQPRLAILDETDSGLDLDAMTVVTDEISQQIKDTGMSVILITHYQKMLTLINVDKVIVLKKGLVVDEGGSELVAELGKTGYKKYD